MNYPYLQRAGRKAEIQEALKQLKKNYETRSWMHPMIFAGFMGHLWMIICMMLKFANDLQKK